MTACLQFRRKRAVIRLSSLFVQRTRGRKGGDANKWDAKNVILGSEAWIIKTSFAYLGNSAYVPAEINVPEIDAEFVWPLAESHDCVPTRMVRCLNGVLTHAWVNGRSVTRLSA
jgi:hypothetical protein